ncbi:MAG TPA: thiol-disulfide oxidoreductase DCC family protein [Abditibacteriaceae bacterium]|jgi:predicted DCC family thiol-disulfide oxidoreductase YuxK
MTKQPLQSVILFDGDCGLCNGVVNFVLRHDERGRFRFAPLQSPAGQRLLQSHGLPPEGVNSFLLLEHGKLFSRSTAALRLARRLGGVWALFYCLMLVPRPLRDAVYGLIARYRYRVFGHSDACMIPTSEQKRRFVEEPQS